MDNYFDQLEDELKEKPINWREIFEKLVTHWKWFVLSVIIAIIAGFFYIRLQQDVYEVKASMLIIDQSRSGQMNEMSVLKQLDAVGLRTGSSSAMINNEEKVLTSTTLMKRVVKLLELHTNYTEIKYLKRADVYNESALYVRLDSLSLYNLSSTIDLTFEPANSELILTGNYKDEEFSETITKLPAFIKTPAGVIYVQLRPGKVLPENKLEVTISHPNAIAKGLSKSALTTEVGKMLDVIELTFKTTNIKKGQDILNTLANVYNLDASEQNNLSAVNTAKFIDTRLDLLAKELNEVEKEVENYKQSNNLTDISEDAKIMQEKNNLYDQREIEVSMQQNLIKYIDDFLKDPSNNNSLVPNLGLTDAGLMSVIEAYNILLLKKARISEGVSDNNPTLKSLNLEIDAARKAIHSSVISTRKGLQITRNDLSGQNDKMKDKILSIPRKEREYIEIKRQQQVKATLYTFLLQKREEASLNMAVTVPKGRILNAPDDAQHVSPKSKIILTVFFLIGLVIPAVLIYLFELINTTIRNRTDVENYTDVPVLTELAHSKTDDAFYNK